MEIIREDLKNLRNEVKAKLEFCNIFRQVALIAHMNRYLEIQIQWFEQMEILKNQPKQDIQEILRSIPFLKYEQVNRAGKLRKAMRLQYNLPASLLSVTGIYEDALNKLVSNYNQIQKKQINNELMKTPFPRRISNNGFFTLIDAHTNQNAENLKGYLRSRKKNLEDQSTPHLIIENRKVRIITINDEDLFTFLVDIMSEYKASKFMKSMTQCDKISILRQPSSKLSYRTFSINGLPFYQQNFQNYLLNNTPKTKEVKPYPKYGENCEEDESSQSTSLNSDILDSKLQDVSEFQVNKAIKIAISNLKHKSLNENVSQNKLC